MKFNGKIICAIAILTAAIVLGVKMARPPEIASAAEELSAPARHRVPNFRKSEKPKPDLTRWKPLLDDSLRWENRLVLAEGIREGITPAEVEFLFSALDHTPAAGTEEQWWVVMNEIMERMRRYGLGADQYAARLGKVVADSNRSEVARDYAIQHLLQWVSPGDPKISPAEADPATRSQTLALVSSTIRQGDRCG